MNIHSFTCTYNVFLLLSQPITLSFSLPLSMNPYFFTTSFPLPKPLKKIMPHLPASINSQQLLQKRIRLNTSEVSQTTKFDKIK